MALTKQKKAEVIEAVASALADSKLTVAARYSGTSVQAMQELRKEAKDKGAVVKVIKNRLFKKALGQVPAFKALDASLLEGQLLYAFSAVDELSPAQALADFAKRQPQLELVAGLSSLGEWLSAEDVMALASLPTKDQLKAQLVGVIAAPLGGFISVNSANLRGLAQVFTARAEAIE